MKLFISDIESKIKNQIPSNPTKQTLDIILAAINDWPNPVLSLDDFEMEVAQFIKGKTTKGNLEKRLKNIDYNKDSWKAESLTQLIDIYSTYNGDMSLKEIIEDLKIKIKDW